MATRMLRRTEARNRLRLPSERALLEALESSDDLAGRVLSIHTPAGEGEVFVVLPPLGEALDRISSQASAFGGDLAPFSRTEENLLKGDGRGDKLVERSIEEYLEALPLVPLEKEPEEHWRGEHLILIRGGLDEYRRILNSIFKFDIDSARGFLETAALEEPDSGFLVRLRGLSSIFPFLQWEDDGAVKVFTPFQESSRLYVEKGFTHPVRRFEDYHRRLGEFTLAPSGEPWLRFPRVQFAPITSSVDLRAGIHEEPLKLDMKDFGPDERLEVRLELVNAGSESAGAHHQGKLNQRIQRLERFRDRTNARLSELYGILKPRSEGPGGGVLYCFSDNCAESLFNFVASYPFSFVKEFRYLPVYWRLGEKEGGILHLLEAPERAALPPVIAVDCEVYRADGNFDRLGIPVYIPAGDRLWPAVHFSVEDAAVLRSGIFGDGECDTKFCFLRRLKGSRDLLKLVLDRRDFVPLSDSVRFLNRTVRTGVVEAINRTARDDLEDEASKINKYLRGSLERLSEEIRAEISSGIEGLREEAEKILGEIEIHRSSLSACEERLARNSEVQRALQELEEKNFLDLRDLLEGVGEAALHRFQEPTARRTALEELLEKLNSGVKEALESSLGRIQREASLLKTRWSEFNSRVRRLEEEIGKVAARFPPGTDEREVLSRALQLFTSLKKGGGE